MFTAYFIYLFNHKKIITMKKLMFYTLLTVILLLLYLQSLIQRPMSVYPKHSQMYSNFITRNDYIATTKDHIEQEFSNNFDLNNYTIAIGRKRLQNIIIATWRSGSTFLGDVINAVPGNFYHFEPLQEYENFQIRGSPHEDLAMKNIKQLLNCNYTNLNSYLDYCKKKKCFFKRNKMLSIMCHLVPTYCYDPTFLSNVCKLFPFYSMKFVRLRLRPAEQLLMDKSLNVRVVLLVRDPRAIVLSRSHVNWCNTFECPQTDLLCADMVSDYKAAVKLTKLYPSRFRVTRYEDLSVDPYKEVKELFDFFHLYFHPSVKIFLDTHTKFELGGQHSTFRHSKTTPFHWQAEMKFSEVQFVEKNCDQAMKLWGYVKAFNETHLREFNPVTSYTVD